MLQKLAVLDGFFKPQFSGLAVPVVAGQLGDASAGSAGVAGIAYNSAAEKIQLQLGLAATAVRAGGQLFVHDYCP